MRAAAYDSRRPHSSAPTDAMSASTSQALRAPRQLRLSRQPTCPPLRSSSRRDRAIHSRPDPVRWSVRRDTPIDEAGIGPQAAGPPSQPA
jgi:hypothetical protein